MLSGESMCTTIIRSGEDFSVVTPSRLHVVRQARRRDRDAVLHEHLRRIEIGAELEGDGDRHVAVARRVGRHVDHVLDAVDLLLDRRRDGGGDRLGVGARIGRAHHDRGRGDLGILGDRQAEIGDGADEHQDDGQDGREDRPLDEGMRESASGSPLSGRRLARAGGSSVILGCTSTPGRTRMRPLITIVSSPLSPSRITR